MNPLRGTAAGLVVAVLAILGWVGYGIYNSATGPKSAMDPLTQPVAGRDSVPIGGPFKLVDQNGKRRSDMEFRGQLMLVYFGYTYCPDVCPVDVAKMTEAMDLLGEEGQIVRPIFITIDPERDTPEVLKDFVGSFHPRMIGLTGSPEEVAAAAKEFRVYYAKAPVAGSAPDSYLMDHSAFIYLLGVNGHYLTHFGRSATPEQMAEAIRKYL